MSYEQLNNRIYDYICNDKTHSAIMLNGDWGCGKSYYINNVLNPFLEKKGKSCYIVSLYGLKDLSEISKLIYIEIKINEFKRKKLKNFFDRFNRKYKLKKRLKKFLDKFNFKYETKEKLKKFLSKFKPESDAAKTAKVISKTVILSVASYFNINLNQNQNDWQKLYESINLSDKLIIFDDIERSSIDIIEMMGYFNHLVEQDGVKILLVANEKELISEPLLNDEKAKDKNNKPVSIVETYEGLKSHNYFKFKEKTISETIDFSPSIKDTIDSILDMLDDGKKYLQRFKTEFLYNFYEDLYCRLKIRSEVLGTTEKLNFRIFIFATQKFVDILKFEYINKYKNNYDFIDTIYYSIICFSTIMKCNKEVKWEENYGNDYSFQLGNANYPLFKFCYDYIMFHTLPTEEIIENSYNAYFRLENFIQNKSKFDTDLISLKSFRLYKESQVRKFLNNLKLKLESPLTISFFEYFNIAKILIELSKVIGFDYSDLRKLMYNNLHEYYGNEDVKKILNEGERIASLLINEEKYKYSKEYSEFIEYLKSALGEFKERIDFPNDVSELQDYYNDVCNNRDNLFLDGSFMNHVNIANFIELLKQCAPNDIDTIRGIFLAIYRPNTSNNLNFCIEDLLQLKDLKSKICDYLKKYNGDKIVIHQLIMFSENLDDFINAVEK